MSGFQAAAVSGSVMILVITLLRLTAGKRLPRALFPALWCAAAFRLLLPVRLPSALAIASLWRSITTFIEGYFSSAARIVTSLRS